MAELKNNTVWTSEVIYKTGSHNPGIPVNRQFIKWFVKHPDEIEKFDIDFSDATRSALSVCSSYERALDTLFDHAGWTPMAKDVQIFDASNVDKLLTSNDEFCGIGVLRIDEAWTDVLPDIPINHRTWFLVIDAADGIIGRILELDLDDRIDTDPRD